MVLHLVVVVLFQQKTNCALHIPGKLVPRIVAFLRNHLDNDQYVKISVFEQMVIEQRKLSPRKVKDDLAAEECSEGGHVPEEEEEDAQIEGRPGEIAHETESRASDKAKFKQEMLDDLKQMVIKHKET